MVFPDTFFELPALKSTPQFQQKELCENIYGNYKVEINV
jgi:hypothetical protein